METKNDAINIDSSAQSIQVQVDSIECGCKLKPISECECLNQLLQSVTYFQSLDITKDELAQNKLVQFLNETHKSLLDDFIHVITKHNNDLDEISKIISPCNFRDCSLLQRHFRNRAQDKSQLNKEFRVYVDIIDSIHCYLYHLYDVGLRVRSNDIKYENNNENDHFDKELAANVQSINKRKTLLKQLKTGDFKRYSNQKYSIPNINTNAIDINYEHNGSDTTFMDGLYQYILNKDASATKTHKILNDEEYDSDALFQDIDTGSYNNQTDEHSNIAQIVDNENHYNLIRQYIKQTKLGRHSFSIGYIFYYWNYYKNNHQLQDSEESYNKNDHSGYAPHELYISLKYKSIKEEILNNAICSLNINEYMLSLIKAEQYIDTAKAKEIYAGDYEDMLHYNIEYETKLSVSNLLSVILYTDWSQLCTEFTKTFRKIKQYETIEMVKQRNREYSQWAKKLRETIQYFGQPGWMDDKGDKYNIEVDRERGPFFCGMSTVMVVPEFNIRLCSPTSTSKQISVALRFSGHEGMLLQLNNNGDGAASVWLRCWNCSWISNYNGEDERLFIGGDWQIKLENIMHIHTKQNYYVFLKPLYYFDCMVSGTVMNADKEPECTDLDHRILFNLIKHKVGVDGYKNEYDKYTNELFEAFVNNKTQIVLNLPIIGNSFDKLRDLIMYTILPKKVIDAFIKENTSKIDDEKLFMFIKKVNLFKTIIFQLFENMKEITIYTTMPNSDHIDFHFPMDLSTLLIIIDVLRSFVTNKIKITICATQKYVETDDGKLKNIDVSWISKLWNKTSTSIISEYKAKHFKICLQQKKTCFCDDELIEDRLIIRQI